MSLCAKVFSKHFGSFVHRPTTYLTQKVFVQLLQLDESSSNWLAIVPDNLLPCLVRVFLLLDVIELAIGIHIAFTVVHIIIIITITVDIIMVVIIDLIFLYVVLHVILGGSCQCTFH